MSKSLLKSAQITLSVETLSSSIVRAVCQLFYQLFPFSRIAVVYRTTLARIIRTGSIPSITQTTDVT